MTPRAIINRVLCCGQKAAAACPHGSACNIGQLFKDDTDAILAALTAAGFAVVPREPTPAMERAGIMRQEVPWDNVSSVTLWASNRWAAMIAAAEGETR